MSENTFMVECREIIDEARADVFFILGDFTGCAWPGVAMTWCSYVAARSET